MLVNRRRDGTIERFDNLCFHGGEGFTLEFRVFSRHGLLESVEKAGFRVAEIYEKIAGGLTASPLGEQFVLVAEKRGEP